MAGTLQRELFQFFCLSKVFCCSDLDFFTSLQQLPSSEVRRFLKTHGKLAALEMNCLINLKSSSLSSVYKCLSFFYKGKHSHHCWNISFLSFTLVELTLFLTDSNLFFRMNLHHFWKGYFLFQTQIVYHKPHFSFYDLLLFIKNSKILELFQDSEPLQKLQSFLHHFSAIVY